MKSCDESTLIEEDCKDILPLFEDCLKDSKYLFGLNHPHVFYTYKSLTRYLFIQTNFSVATKTIQLFYETLRLKYGKKHPTTLIAASMLGECFLRQGEMVKSEHVLSETLTQQRLILEKTDLELLQTIHLLGVWYYEFGNFKLAENFLLECLPIRQEILGIEDINTLATMLKLAQVYNIERKFSLAEIQFQNYVNYASEIYGNQSSKVYLAKKCLVDNLVLQWKYEEAQPILFEFWLYCIKIHGENKLETSESANDLAMLYFKMGNYEKAGDLLREYKERSKFNFGEKHPHYKLLLNNFNQVQDFIKKERFSNLRAKLKNLNEENKITRKKELKLDDKRLHGVISHMMMKKGIIHPTKNSSIESSICSIS